MNQAQVDAAITLVRQMQKRMRETRLDKLNTYGEWGRDQVEQFIKDNGHTVVLEFEGAFYPDLIVVAYPTGPEIVIRMDESDPTEGIVCPSVEYALTTMVMLRPKEEN